MSTGRTYPKHGQHVSNLLSKGIVNADGTPGPNRALARQFQARHDQSGVLLHQQRQADRARQDGLRAVPARRPRPAARRRRPSRWRSSRRTRPSPRRRSTRTRSPPLCFTRCRRSSTRATCRSLTSGATGLANCTADPTEPPSACADARHAHRELQRAAEHRVSDHRAERALRQLHGRHGASLLPHVAAVGLRRRPRDGRQPVRLPQRSVSVRRHRARRRFGQSNSMGFYNMQKGDAPVFKRLADEYTMSDNYHQPVMGGTAVQHTMLMTGDQIFWEPSGSFPRSRRSSSIVDPTPKSATNVGVRERSALDQVRRSNAARHRCRSCSTSSRCRGVPT